LGIAIAASTNLVQITHIVDLAISTNRTSEILAHVVMGLNLPVATVILLAVPVMVTLVLATNTNDTLAIPAIAAD